MRAAAALRPAAAENDAILHDHRADRRRGPGGPQPAAAEREGKRHEARIGALVVRGRLSLDWRYLIVHLRKGVAGFGASSSPDNSSSAARKSFASRKLR